MDLRLSFAGDEKITAKSVAANVKIVAGLWPEGPFQSVGPFQNLISLTSG